VKLRKEIRDTCAASIEERFEKMKEEAERLLDELWHAETYEDFMRAKREFMFAILAALPLDRDSCPFCMRSYSPLLMCRRCEYAKIHGACNQDGSTFGKIWNALRALKCALMEYYKGEKYDGVWEAEEQKCESGALMGNSGGEK